MLPATHKLFQGRLNCISVTVLLQYTLNIDNWSYVNTISSKHLVNPLDSNPLFMPNTQFRPVFGNATSCAKPGEAATQSYDVDVKQKTTSGLMRMSVRSIHQHLLCTGVISIQEK